MSVDSITGFVRRAKGGLESQTGDPAMDKTRGVISNGGQNQTGDLEGGQNQSGGLEANRTRQVISR